MTTKDFVYDWLWKFWKANAPEKAKHRDATVKRLEKYLKEHKDISFDDIKKAVILYFKENQDRKYIRYPLYFIWKRIDGTKISDLKVYLDKVKKIKNKHKIQ